MIAHKLKCIAMNFVRIGLGYSFDHSAGVLPVLRGNRTGFGFEFLQGVRKRQRLGKTAVRIVCCSLVSLKFGRRIRLTTGLGGDTRRFVAMRRRVAPDPPQRSRAHALPFRRAVQVLAADQPIRIGRM